MLFRANPWLLSGITWDNPWVAREDSPWVAIEEDNPWFAREDSPWLAEDSPWVADESPWFASEDRVRSDRFLSCTAWDRVDKASFSASRDLISARRLLRASVRSWMADSSALILVTRIWLWRAFNCAWESDAELIAAVGGTMKLTSEENRMGKRQSGPSRKIDFEDLPIVGIPR